MTVSRSQLTPNLVRLRRRSEFVFVRGGKSVRRHSVVVQARQNRLREADTLGMGVTATKKIGNAVTRNRAKRRLRAAGKFLLPRCGRANVDYVFIARRDTATIGWQRLLDDMESALISLADQFHADPGSP